MERPDLLGLDLPWGGGRAYSSEKALFAKAGGFCWRLRFLSPLCSHLWKDRNGPAPTNGLGRAKHPGKPAASGYGSRGACLPKLCQKHIPARRSLTYLH